MFSYILLSLLTKSRSVQQVELLPFSITFNFDQSRLPTAAEYDEVASVTNDHISTFFQTVLGAPDVVATTTMTGQQLVIGQPVVISFQTTVSSDTSALLDAEEYSRILPGAFIGDQLATYQTEIDGLDGNVLSTTDEITFAFLTDTNSTDNANTQFTGIIVGATVGTIALLVVAGFTFKRRQVKRHGKANYMDAISDTGSGSGEGSFEPSSGDEGLMNDISVLSIDSLGPEYSFDDMESSHPNLQLVPRSAQSAPATYEVGTEAFERLYRTPSFPPKRSTRTT